MAPPNSVRQASQAPPKPSALSRNAQKDSVKDTTGTPSYPPNAINDPPNRERSGEKVESVIEGIEQLEIRPDFEKRQNSRRSAQDAPRGGTDSTEDEQSHLSNSSTKGPNFDTKSMASVTTFAMDEKESLRPDDSASVRAAEDDDHTQHSFKGHGPQLPTDAVASIRDQENEAFGGVRVAMRRPPMGIMQNPPQFGDFPLPSAIVPTPSFAAPAPADTNVQETPAPNSHLLSIAPDEKLLDAMNSPKDRLLLLQLEERIIHFIKNSP